MEEEAQVVEEVEVPCYFLCPISLCLMRDPVTLPTGITYDRDGIERWLLTGADTCPLTKQPVSPDCHPTPNHTLRRLIQSWCAAHPTADTDHRVVHHTPSSKPRAADIAVLVSRVRAAAASSSAGSSPATPPQQELLAALRELRDAAAESDRNRKLVAAVPGAVDLLAAVFSASANAKSDAAAAVRDEALEVLSSLQQQVPEESLRRAAEANEASLITALVAALQQRSSPPSRARAAAVLDRVTAALPSSRLASLPEQLFTETVELLRDREASSSSTTTKAALHVLVRTAACGRNRVKAVEASAVGVLVDMLFDADADHRRRRRVCELVLAALDRVCGCAEGRAELVAHAGGVAAVGRKALRVSEVATEKAVRVLRSVARHAATAAVVQEMAQCGAVAALCVVARSSEVVCGERTRERARETLRLHAGAWRNSPCLHHHLKALYPC